MNTREFGPLVAAQVSELWWTLIVRELQAAQKQLRADDPAEATRTLRRVVAHFEPLNATWRSIAWMTPKDLRAMLSEASAKPGEDAPFQGLYDDVLAYFGRLGLSVPAQLFERGSGMRPAPSQEVEQVWREIYEDPYPDARLQQLGDTLVEIAEAFTDWQHRRLMATRRMSLGADSLRLDMSDLTFPELWSARGSIEDVAPPGIPLEHGGPLLFDSKQPPLVGDAFQALHPAILK